MRCLFFSLFVFSIVQAQPTVMQLNSAQELAAQLEAAQKEILYSVPTLRSHEISESLRRTALRGVKVFMLVDPYQAELPDSYVPSLEHPQLAQIALSSIGLSFAVIDRMLVIEGPLLSTANVVFDSPDTFIVRDEVLAKNRIQHFLSQWNQAPKYLSFIHFISIEGE